jgi:cytosine/adenosine deaminase-related metal-dependent hydrolase
MSRFLSGLLCLCAVPLGAAAPRCAAGPPALSRFALRGTVGAPGAPTEDAVVVVSGGRIEAVGRIAVPPGVPVIETHGFIYPGLIDLHNHLTWNVFPRWSSGRKFPNRYEWQILPAYLRALADPHARMIKEGYGPSMALYGEVKAVVGGATALAGLYPGDLGPSFHPPYHGLMRMLDLGSGFYPDGTPEAVRYEVFPLVLSEANAAEIRAGLQSHRIRSLLIHLGEGAPHDASSMMEYRILKARGLLLPGVSLIHGVALHEAQFQEMHDLGVGLVWSPRSNFELYGATADVAAAKRARVRIALAPDWSPTGSDGLLQELAYAARWNAEQARPVFSEEELVALATAEPARLAGVDDRIGALRPGLCADLLVIRGPRGALVGARPADVALSVIGGEARYGDPALVEAVAPGRRWTPLSIQGTAKALVLPGASGDWTEVTTRLDGALRALGTRLGPLVED